MDNIYSKNIVKELVKNDFNITKDSIKLNKNITSNLNGIIVIYAPWCETCNMTKDLWENIAILFKYKFNIYAINAYNFDDNNQDLTLPLDVRIYPSYKFVNKNGEISTFNGKINESELVKYIVKHIV